MLAAACALARPAVVRADGGDYTEIASSFDEDDPFDLHVSIDYAYSSYRAGIKREIAGVVDPNLVDRTALGKDLVYEGTRHTITPRLTVGLAPDVELSLALPVVLRDAYTLSFDRTAGSCVLPPAPGATCVNALNSTTVQDGLLPPTGFDADDPGGPGFTDPDDPTIFRGTTRKGLDQLHVGLAWAPMNQRRDDTKPTWKIGAQLRLAVGDTAEFDPERPSRSTGVGRGLHEVRLWTSVAKRAGWAEPFVELWWQAPIGKTDDSHFVELGFGEERAAAQQLAGVRFGFEGVTWEHAADSQRIGLELSMLAEAHFEGRDYTPMWEVFQLAGDPDRAPDGSAGPGPLALDGDPATPGLQGVRHPGVTNVENYMRFAGRIRINAQLGERVRFSVGAQIVHDTSHLITFADAGRDLPQCAAGQTSGCEPDNDDTVDPDQPEEVNPYHVPLIDQAGHRYKQDDTFDYQVLVRGMVLF